MGSMGAAGRMVFGETSISRYVISGWWSLVWGDIIA